MTAQKFNNLLKNIHDEKCFKILYNEYYPYIIKYGLLLYKNRAVAEDIASDIFVYLLTHSITTEIRKPNVWLFTIVKHQYGKYKTNTESIDEHPELSGQMFEYMSLDVRTAIEKLSVSEQEIIVLKWYCGFSLKDIALYQSRSVIAVWKQHERILKKLKNFLSS